ncbi:hypothetical protein VSH64_40510 [Amycolatopsis rhabdoformis]|uniref:DUF4232 domain-containing protein n=1 Tax=Amycolatopsis rhabdoformis TaxID=1448059 RepID=A0ABZ1I3Q9_9PSEU|nr:hypothetical protein [Amycolatopsis rhabdoformis]WSE29039.1 hypothetical protein VSH64_40510 [Amycolatopsis rhabdoformis]
MTRVRGRVAALVLAGLLTASCSVAPSGSGVILGSSTFHPATSSSPPPPPRRLEAPTETHTGKGNATVALAWPTDVPGYLTFDCPHCDSNIFVHTDGDEFSLINAIGKYHGTVWFNAIEGRDPTRTLTITANSSWTATITDHRTLPTITPGKPYSAKGDAVLAIPAGITHAQFHTASRGHSAVWVQRDGTMDLPVNEIDATTIDFPVTGPTLVEVEAYESSWTLTAS